MSKNVYFNKRQETEDRTNLQELQSKLFRKSIKYAGENSPFYARRFKELGLDSSQIRDIHELQKIKFFTTKDDLRKGYPFGFLAVPRNSIAEMHATSGTTGNPTLGLHTEKDLDDWAEISARSLVMSGLTKDDVFQITPSLGMFSGGFGFYHGGRRVGTTIVPASAGFSKRQIQYMMDFGTTMFCAIVSYAFRLVEVAQEMGIDLRKQTKVRKGIFGSEIWTREMKSRLANVWDVDPYDVYGFTELYGPGVGNDCKVHDGLHIWEDYFLVEVVDPKTGDVLGAEEEGELVFTSLRKEAMPLIRYRSHDVSRLLDAQSCDCGRTHKRYEEITARTDDMLKISGVNFWPSQLESVLLKEKELGMEYRITLSKNHSLEQMTIEVESKEEISDPVKIEFLSKKLEGELRDAFLFSPRVEIVKPSSLPRHEAGKQVRIIDQRKSPG